MPEKQDHIYKRPLAERIQIAASKHATPQMSFLMRGKEFLKVPYPELLTESQEDNENGLE